MRCGYCRRDTAEISVEVRSRGETYTTYAHKTCIRKWRRISEIRVVGDEVSHSLLGDVKHWFGNLRQNERKAEQKYEGKWRETPKTCKDCGAPIERHSTYCLRCEKFHTDYSTRGKLTPEQVKEIRSLMGEHTMTEIAKMFDVSVASVSNIANNKTWRRLQSGHG